MGVAQSALDPCIKCFKFTPPADDDHVAYQPVNQSTNSGSNVTTQNSHQSNQQTVNHATDEDNWDEEFEDFLDDESPKPVSNKPINQSSNQPISQNNQPVNQQSKQNKQQLVQYDREIIDDRSIDSKPQSSPTSIKTMSLSKLPPPPAPRPVQINQPAPIDLFDSLGMSTKYTEPVRVPKKQVIQSTNQSVNPSTSQPAADVSKYLDDDSADVTVDGWGDDLDLIDDSKSKKKRGIGSVMAIED